MPFCGSAPHGRPPRRDRVAVAARLCRAIGGRFGPAPRRFYPQLFCVLARVGLWLPLSKHVLSKCALGLRVQSVGTPAGSNRRGFTVFGSRQTVEIDPFAGAIRAYSARSACRSLHNQMPTDVGSGPNRSSTIFSSGRSGACNRAWKAVRDRSPSSRTNSTSIVDASRSSNIRSHR